MLEAIKNACIFLLIAQILMVLVPEEAYAKYVRVLVSLILILKITQLILISGREAQEVIQANVEQLYVELSVRELPSSIQRETGNLYAHMTEYVAGQIAQEQDLQKQDRQGRNKQEQNNQEQSMEEEVTDQQQFTEDVKREE